MDPLRSARGGTPPSRDLAGEIADALTTSGEYVAEVDLVPTQGLVDFHWAAHVAGRMIGIRVRIDVHAAKQRDERALIRVTPRPHHGRQRTR